MFNNVNISIKKLTIINFKLFLFIFFILNFILNYYFGISLNSFMYYNKSTSGIFYNITIPIFEFLSLINYVSYDFFYNIFAIINNIKYVGNVVLLESTVFCIKVSIIEYMYICTFDMLETLLTYLLITFISVFHCVVFIAIKAINLPHFTVFMLFFFLRIRGIMFFYCAITTILIFSFIEIIYLFNDMNLLLNNYISFLEFYYYFKFFFFLIFNESNKHMNLIIYIYILAVDVFYLLYDVYLQLCAITIVDYNLIIQFLIIVFLINFFKIRNLLILLINLFLVLTLVFILLFLFNLNQFIGYIILLELTTVMFITVLSINFTNVYINKKINSNTKYIITLLLLLLVTFDIKYYSEYISYNFNDLLKNKLYITNNDFTGITLNLFFCQSVIVMLIGLIFFFVTLNILFVWLSWYKNKLNSVNINKNKKLTDRVNFYEKRGYNESVVNSIKNKFK